MAFLFFDNCRPSRHVQPIVAHDGRTSNHWLQYDAPRKLSSGPGRPHDPWSALAEWDRRLAPLKNLAGPSLPSSECLDRQRHDCSFKLSVVAHLDVYRTPESLPQDASRLVALITADLYKEGAAWSQQPGKPDRPEA